MDTKLLFLDLRGELSSERHTNVPFVLEHFHHLMVMQRYKPIQGTPHGHVTRTQDGQTRTPPHNGKNEVPTLDTRGSNGRHHMSYAYHPLPFPIQYVRCATWRVDSRVSTV